MSGGLGRILRRASGRPVAFSMLPADAPISTVAELAVRLFCSSLALIPGVLSVGRESKAGLRSRPAFVRTIGQASFGANALIRLAVLFQ